MVTGKDDSNYFHFTQSPKHVCDFDCLLSYLQMLVFVNWKTWVDSCLQSLDTETQQDNDDEYNSTSFLIQQPSCRYYWSQPTAVLWHIGTYDRPSTIGHDLSGHVKESNRGRPRSFDTWKQLKLFLFHLRHYCRENVIAWIFQIDLSNVNRYLTTTRAQLYFAHWKVA